MGLRKNEWQRRVTQLARILIEALIKKTEVRCKQRLLVHDRPSYCVKGALYVPSCTVSVTQLLNNLLRKAQPAAALLFLAHRALLFLARLALLFSAELALVLHWVLLTHCCNHHGR